MTSLCFGCNLSMTTCSIVKEGAGAYPREVMYLCSVRGHSRREDAVLYIGSISKCMWFVHHSFSLSVQVTLYGSLRFDCKSSVL